MHTRNIVRKGRSWGRWHRRPGWRRDYRRGIERVLVLAGDRRCAWDRRSCRRLNRGKRERI